MLGENLAALLLAGLLKHDATGEDDVVAVAVHLDDAGLDAGAHVGGEVLDTTEVDEGGGQEATQADVEDQAALDNLDNLALDVLAGVELLLDAVPSTLVLGTLLGQDQTTVLVLIEVGDGAVNEAVHLLVGNVIHGEDGRVLNLTQRWTPFELRGPDC